MRTDPVVATGTELEDTATGSGAGVGVAAGAMPHTLQKPSSMAPVHPGRRHAVMALAP